MEKRILIADDHYVVRMGTAIIIEDHYPQIMIDHAQNFSQVLEKITENEYALVILDIEMPGSTFEHMIKEIKKIRNDIKILIFTSHKEKEAIPYLSVGANGYLNKSCEDTKILDAIQSIFTEGYYYPQVLLHDFINNKNYKPESSETRPLDLLSEREAIIYQYLVEGNGILEISNKLDLHMSTISTHKLRIFKKLQVNSIAELVHLHNKYYS
ncbi:MULTISPECIES: response regulator transcription factor [Chryseobacterium]|jgi:DNA-binding NarL/FixJ family response regulator|uniref:DNA-binding NarL/FixJ family response regulator n=1 Tax=Chryseobacterium geocarposphaerae TaxID=1416776 RepID=A0ABU1LBE6_9FLAO|nr:MULTISPECIES: response regulator transcription factor [Chryseobacterium]MDR6404052.1 DNA-binding NarL/FixJ family response regulator [Chryseobacterium geocarposphaerae]MDR6698429.1 DNA-binding NarL/FixJ family response regulator [Chryseobacterium ginsenosidimutans]